MGAIAMLEGAYAEKTIRESVACFRLFARWCALHDRCPFPASSETMAAYVSMVFERYATRTVDSHVSMIRRAHRAAGHPDPTQAREVWLAYRRGVRSHGRPARQAHPLSAALRDRLLEACPSTLLGLRDRAMISLGYDTLCRRSELVALRVEDLRPMPGGGASIPIRRSKTRPFGDGRPAYVSPRALEEVNAWLAAAGVASGPILRRVRFTVAGPGELHPRTVNQRLAALASLASLDPAIAKRLTSHSMRVGAAQDLAADGRGLLEIMRAGRWRGLNAVALYVRDAPVDVWRHSDGDIYPLARESGVRRGARAGAQRSG